MSPRPGRPKAGSLPLGGKARSAKGARMSPPGRRAGILLAAAIAAAGCTSLLPNQAKTYYLLQDLHDGQQSESSPPHSPLRSGARPAMATTAGNPAASKAAPVVLISVNPASTLYESAGIVFSRGPGQLAFYQFATWSERPSRRLGLMVERRLVEAVADGAPLSGAALDTSGVRGDWILGVRLVDLYHDTTTTPHRAVVTVEAELVDWERRRMLDRAVFSATTDLRAEHVQAAVAAMNQGVTAALDQLAEWLAEKARDAPATAGAMSDRPYRQQGTPPTGASRPPRPCPPHCP